MSPERKLERQLVAYCKKNDIYCRKFVSPGHSGVPDRILIRNGHVLFLELKSPGKKLAPLQLRENYLIGLAGVSVACTDSWEGLRLCLFAHFP